MIGSPTVTTPMNNYEKDEVDQLLLNARLRDELEPYLDESIDLLTVRGKPTPFENEYLMSMLAWERAPIVSIAEWFSPPLELRHPDSLTPDELRTKLWEAIQHLCEKHIVLDYTDHLSDRELYCLILRDILPSPEKKLAQRTTYLHWHCIDPEDNPETWLRYYASTEERTQWYAETGNPPPPPSKAPYARHLPRRAV
jgi:hypothetical protein